MKKVVVGDCARILNDDYTYIVSRLRINGWLNTDCTYDKGKEKERLGGVSGHMTHFEFIPTLHLPISEPWFSRILSGEKTEEYREIEGREGTFRNCSLIWGVSAKCAMDVYDSANHVGEMSFAQWMNEQNKKDFQVLHLTNGYGHHRPQLWVHIKEITIGRGNPEWGAPEHDVFIIKLGEVFHTKNIKK